MTDRIQSGSRKSVPQPIAGNSRAGAVRSKTAEVASKETRGAAADSAEVVSDASRRTSGASTRSQKHSGELAEFANRQRQHAQLSGAATLAQRDDASAAPTATVDRSYPAGEKYGQVTEFSFAKPVTREQALTYLYTDKALPSRGDRIAASEFTKSATLKALDSSMGWPGRKWRLVLPNVNTGTSRMRSEAFDALFGAKAGTAESRFQGSPPTTPTYTAGLLERGTAPDVGDPKLDYVKKSGDTTVWKEDGQLFWFDASEKRYEGIKLRDEDFMQVYNKDIEHYVTEKFMPPGKAVRAFVKQWKHINLSMLGAFAYALGSGLGTNTGGALSPVSLDDQVVDAARESR